MHTTKIGDVAFIHNGGYDGDVYISLQKSKIEESVTNENYVLVTIPFDTLKNFVASYIRRKKVAQLESSDDDEILGL